MGEKYLITGASGFIGTHLIERLLSTESTIICIDRSFSDAFDFKFSRYFNHKIIKLELNILDENVVKNIIDSHNPNYIIHLAAYIDRNSKVDAFRTAMEVNYFGTLSLLNSVVNNSYIENILLLGTADEYGKINSKYNEESKLYPLTPYGISKSASTNLALSYYYLYKLPVNVIRPSIAYGPGQKSNMFIPSLILSLLDNKIFRMSHGDQFRNFIYIDDLVDAILLIINEKSIAGEIINIGSQRSLKLKDVALTIGSMIGQTNNILIGDLPYRETEIMNYHLDVSKAKDLIGFTAKHSINEGLSKTIKSYSNQDS